MESLDTESFTPHYTASRDVVLMVDLVTQSAGLAVHSGIIAVFEMIMLGA